MYFMETNPTHTHLPFTCCELFIWLCDSFVDDGINDARHCSDDDDFEQLPSGSFNFSNCILR